MINLIRVELLRLSSRRVVRWLALALFVGLVAINAYRFTRHSNDNADARRQAEQQVEQFRERARLDYDRSFVGIPEEQRPSLEEYVGGITVESFYQDPRYRMTSSADEAKAVGIFVALLAFAIGTTFAGAEWAAGTMQALLFWEPRRLRVVAAKVLALALVVVVVSLLAQLVQVGFAAATASLRGTFAGTGSGFYRAMAATGLRLAALGVCTSGLAFGLAGLIRNTGGALGVAFVYFAVVENAVRGLRPTWARFLISEQATAWVQKGFSIFLPPTMTPNGEYIERAPIFLSMNRAGLTLLVYLTVVLAAMTALFLRRDVT